MLHGVCWFVVNVLCGFLEAGWCQNRHTPHLLPPPCPGSNGARWPADEPGPHSGVPWPLVGNVQAAQHSACSHRPKAPGLLEQAPHTSWTHRGPGQESAQWQEKGGVLVTACISATTCSRLWSQAKSTRAHQQETGGKAQGTGTPRSTARVCMLISH